MCGLGGMMGTAINQQDIDMLHDLSYVLGLRGTDSSGVLQGFVHKKSRSFRVVKQAHEISFFMWWNKHLEKEGGDTNLLTDVTDNFFCVHTRAGTKGFITKENAHPFEKSNIIGMHNGTLIDKKYDDPEKTDSEMMFNDINNRGIVPVLRELELKSAYAIVMFDKRTNRFSFVRNEYRPLYYAVNKKRKVLYWASEARMLYFAAGRNGVELEHLHLFEAGKVFEFNPLDVRINKDPLWSFKSVDIMMPLATPLENRMKFLPPPRTSVPSVNTYSNNNNNVVPITSRPKRRNARKIVTLQYEICTSCQKELDLYEQWKGHEYERGKFLCQRCDETSFRNTQKPSDEVVH